MVGHPGIRTPPAPDNVGRSETSQWPHSCGPRALGRLFSALLPRALERPAGISSSILGTCTTRRMGVSVSGVGHKHRFPLVGHQKGFAVARADRLRSTNAQKRVLGRRAGRGDAARPHSTSVMVPARGARGIGGCSERRVQSEGSIPWVARTSRPQAHPPTTCQTA